MHWGQTVKTRFAIQSVRWILERTYLQGIFTSIVVIECIAGTAIA